MECPQCGSELELQLQVSQISEEQLRNEGYHKSRMIWICKNPDCPKYGSRFIESDITGQLYEVWKN